MPAALPARAAESAGPRAAAIAARAKLLAKQGRPACPARDPWLAAAPARSAPPG